MLNPGKPCPERDRAILRLAEAIQPLTADQIVHLAEEVRRVAWRTPTLRLASPNGEIIADEGGIHVR